jgi:hypothetical protein
MSKNMSLGGDHSKKVILAWCIFDHPARSDPVTGMGQGLRPAKPPIFGSLVISRCINNPILGVFSYIYIYPYPNMVPRGHDMPHTIHIIFTYE